MAICRACSVELIQGQTWSDGQVKARNYTCRKCMAAKGRAWSAANRERANEAQRLRLRGQPERVKEYRAAYYAANKEKWQDYKKNWAIASRQSPNRCARMMMTWTRSRARKRALEFDLTVEFIERLLVAGSCAVTGIEFDMEHKKDGKKGTSPFAPSLDRIDPQKGYTQANVRMVVYIYNCAKSEYSDGIVMDMARALVAMA